MSYTAKDMLKFFDITKETLRFYEKEGLLHPTIGSNNYRYYSDWDVFQLAEYRRLRALDYSIKDIKQTIKTDTKAALLDALEKKQQYYHSRAAFYQRLAQHNNMILHYLAEPFNELRPGKLPQTLYFPAFTSIENFFNEQKYDNFANMDSLAFSLCDFMLSGKLDTPESLVGGTAFFQEMVPQGFDSSHMQVIPEQNAAVINLDVSDGFSLTKDNIEAIPPALRPHQFYAIQLRKVANKRLVRFWILNEDAVQQ